MAPTNLGWRELERPFTAHVHAYDMTVWYPRQKDRMLTGKMNERTGRARREELVRPAELLPCGSCNCFAPGSIGGKVLGVASGQSMQQQYSSAPKAGAGVAKVYVPGQVA